MKIFQNFSEINTKLSVIEKQIFYTIGLPDYAGYGGLYIMLTRMELLNQRYLKFGTREEIGSSDDFILCLDLETKNIVFKFYSDEFNFLNSSLESYLNYVYIFEKNYADVISLEKFGVYELNHQQYAEELKKRFLAYNDDVLKGSWSALVEEMGYGII